MTDGVGTLTKTGPFILTLISSQTPGDCVITASWGSETHSATVTFFLPSLQVSNADPEATTDSSSLYSLYAASVGNPGDTATVRLSPIPTPSISRR